MLDDGTVVTTQRFGNCDEEEKKNLLYRDFFILSTDNAVMSFVTYKVSIVFHLLFPVLHSIRRMKKALR